MLKVKNVSRHYTTKHKDFGNDLSEVEQQTKATKLSRKLTMQQNVLIKGKLAQEASAHASYIVAHNVAKYNKLFSDW